MMDNRLPISASMRWQIFARDNFTCRYCGAQAGEPNVKLEVDHVISVADGGPNRPDNYVTACRKCNGGKGARSLVKLPRAANVERQLRARAKSMQKQADALRSAIADARKMESAAIALKAAAYDRADPLMIDPGEPAVILKLCDEFGAETILSWYRKAAAKGIPEERAVLYVRGIARAVRDASK